MQLEPSKYCWTGFLPAALFCAWAVYWCGLMLSLAMWFKTVLSMCLFFYPFVDWSWAELWFRLTENLRILKEAGHGTCLKKTMFLPAAMPSRSVLLPTKKSRTNPLAWNTKISHIFCREYTKMFLRTNIYPQPIYIHLWFLLVGS